MTNSSIRSVGRRRGFFAELQHQQRLAEQRQRREYAAAVQAHNRAVREAERAQCEYVRAVAAAERASSAEQAVAERAARDAHIQAHKAEAESRTAQAIDALEQIDSILAATLEVDDYVDIAALKLTVEHPPFGDGDLKKPLPRPHLESLPPEPHFIAPPAPTGLSKIFNKQKHADATARAHAAWVDQHEQWADYVHRVLPTKNAKLLEDHGQAEAASSAFADARAEYERACTEREKNVAEANAQLEHCAELLAAGDPEAINQYVGSSGQIGLSRCL